SRRGRGNPRSARVAHDHDTGRSSRGDPPRTSRTSRSHRRRLPRPRRFRAHAPRLGVERRGPSRTVPGRGDPGPISRLIVSALTPPVIEVQDLVKAYGDKTVVDRVSFDVQAGELFGLLGPNGAGKTTV